MTIIKLKCIEAGQENLSYDFEPESGRYELLAHPSGSDASQGARGFGAERRIGVRRRLKVFVAEYSWQATFHVVLDRKRFVWPGPYQVRRRYRRLGGPIRAFTVAEDQQLRAHFHYLYFGSEGPWPDRLDIFESIAATAESPEQLYRFIFYWERNARGESVHTPEFHDRLATYVRERTRN